MKRIRLRTGNRALVVFASLAAASSTLCGCIPEPDISGLPPYDASIQPGFDAASLNGLDSGTDAVTGEDASVNAPTSDAPDNATASITGVVLNYAQGEGRGVVPGATVAVVGGPTTTTDAFGAFALTGVTPGQVQINVSKAADQTAKVAYSSTRVAVTLAGAQNVSVFPVLHQGCYEEVTATASPISVSTTDPGAFCGGLTSQAGLFAELQAGATSLATLDGNVVTVGTKLLVGIIPIGFPQTPSATTDFTWGLGLPGASTPIETIGAAEFRVTAEGADGGPPQVVVIRSGDTGVTLTVPTWKLADATYKPFAYNPTAGTWGAETGTVSSPRSMQLGDGPKFDVVNVTAAQTLGWTGITNDATPAVTCVTGAITANGAPAANVWVHVAGLNYLGASSAVSDSNGEFCVDVKAAPGADAGTAGVLPQVGVAAGYAATSGLFVTLPTAPTSGFQVSGLAGGTCATQSACTAIGSVALTPFDPTCVNGTLVQSDGGVPTTTLDVRLVLAANTVSASQTADGVLSTAYIGTTTPGDGGTFCASAPSGAGTIVLSDPNSTCATAGITVQTGGSASICGGTGCASAGQVAYNCGPPP